MPDRTRERRECSPAAVDAALTRKRQDDVVREHRRRAERNYERGCELGLQPEKPTPVGAQITDEDRREAARVAAIRSLNVDSGVAWRRVAAKEATRDLHTLTAHPSGRRREARCATGQADLAGRGRSRERHTGRRRPRVHRVTGSRAGPSDDDGHDGEPDGAGPFGCGGRA